MVVRVKSCEHGALSPSDTIAYCSCCMCSSNIWCSTTTPKCRLRSCSYAYEVLSRGRRFTIFIYRERGESVCNEMESL